MAATNNTADVETLAAQGLALTKSLRQSVQKCVDVIGGPPGP